MGMATTVSSFNELQLWDLNCLLTDCSRGPCWTCTTETFRTFVNVLQLENLSAFLNQGKLPLRHDRDVDDLDNRGHLAMHNNGHVENQSKSGT